LLDLVAGEGGYVPVAAHPDVVGEAPDREHDVVLPERAGVPSTSSSGAFGTAQTAVVPALASPS